MALAEQYAGRHLGFINPATYQIARVVSCAPPHHETPGARAGSASPTVGEPTRSIHMSRPYPTPRAAIRRISARTEAELVTISNGE